MEPRRILAAAVLIAAALTTGCSSNVQRNAAAPTMTVGAEAFSKVEVALNANAKSQLKDNLKFDSRKLEDLIGRALDAREMLKPEAMHALQVEITDIRVRSAFSAVMFGFMAGDDHINGTAHVTDASGGVLDSLDVEVSYALGGLAGGQDESRMSWLYEEFTKRLMEGLTGEKP